MRALTGACALLAILLMAGTPALAGDGLMWVVRSDTATVYLAGAFPLGAGQEYPLPEDLEAAFSQADALLVKIPPQEGTEGADLAMQYGTYEEGDGLSHHLEVETLQRLVEMGFDPARMEKMRPWVAAMLIYSAAARGMGYSSDFGMVEHFEALAKEQGVEIRGLDSRESMLALLRDAYDRDPDALVQQCFADLDVAPTHLPAVNQAVLDGDADLVAELLFADTSEAQDRYHETMFFAYNTYLADRLEMVLAGQGTYFAALHAGHLVTDRGLPELLEERGYSVERM